LPYYPSRYSSLPAASLFLCSSFLIMSQKMVPRAQSGHPLISFSYIAVFVCDSTSIMNLFSSCMGFPCNQRLSRLSFFSLSFTIPSPFQFNSIDRQFFHSFFPSHPYLRLYQKRFI
jgi:hypothetical protein